jgi:5-methylcytosine-specific restriction endonuclease McrA
MRTWIYKCNATNSAGPDSGDWRHVFNRGTTTWGSDRLKGMDKVRRGDRVLAVQSDRHELVGVAKVLGFVGVRGARRIRLQATERINVKIPPLKRADRKIGSLPALQGGPIATIYDISDQGAEDLLTAARRAKAARRLSAEETDVTDVFVEGATTEIRVNAYERNPAARKACLRHWGTRCVVCGQDFGAMYGEQAEGLIHVHHIVPLGSIRRSYRVNPIRDLRPLCPNCHAVAHRSEPPTSVEDLRRSVMMRRILAAAKRRTAEPAP